MDFMEALRTVVDMAGRYGSYCYESEDPERWGDEDDAPRRREALLAIEKALLGHLVSCEELERKLKVVEERRNCWRERYEDAERRLSKATGKMHEAVDILEPKHRKAFKAAWEKVNSYMRKSLCFCSYAREYEEPYNVLSRQVRDQRKELDRLNKENNSLRLRIAELDYKPKENNDKKIS